MLVIVINYITVTKYLIEIRNFYPCPLICQKIAIGVQLFKAFWLKEVVVKDPLSVLVYINSSFAENQVDILPCHTLFSKKMTVFVHAMCLKA